MKWYKRDPVAAIEGMMGLTPEERGFYNLVIDLLYARDGNVTDDLVIKAMACRPQVWRRVKISLMEKGKVHQIGLGITANRVQSELISAAKRMEVMVALRARRAARSRH